jgi:hypothetical protein
LSKRLPNRVAAAGVRDGTTSHGPLAATASHATQQRRQTEPRAGPARCSDRARREERRRVDVLCVGRRGVLHGAPCALLTARTASEPATALSPRRSRRRRGVGERFRGNGIVRRAGGGRALRRRSACPISVGKNTNAIVRRATAHFAIQGEHEAGSRHAEAVEATRRRPFRGRPVPPLSSGGPCHCSAEQDQAEGSPHPRPDECRVRGLAGSDRR